MTSDSCTLNIFHVSNSIIPTCIFISVHGSIPMARGRSMKWTFPPKIDPLTDTLDDPIIPSGLQAIPEGFYIKKS